MNDLLESLGSAFEDMTDEQKTDLNRAVLILSVSYFSRRALRKLLVGLGVPDAAAKHAYTAIGGVVYAIASNAAVGSRIGQKTVEQYV